MGMVDVVPAVATSFSFNAHAFQEFITILSSMQHAVEHAAHGLWM